MFFAYNTLHNGIRASKGYRNIRDAHGNVAFCFS